jgi:hypothetical protein
MDGFELFQDDGIVHFFAKRGTSVVGGVVQGADHFFNLIVNLRSWDVYAHANVPATKGIKASTKEIHVWRYVVVDIDPNAGGVGRPYDIANAVAARYGGTLVDTGRGMQVLLHLVPVNFNTTVGITRPLAEARMARFLRELGSEFDGVGGCHVDTSCSDLARVVRIPDTINWKTERAAKVLRHGDTYHGYENLLPIVRPPSRVAVTPITEVKQLANVIPHLTDTAARFLTDGWETPGRHAAAYAAAASLKDVGVSKQVAINWVGRGAVMSTPMLGLEEVARVVANAYAKEGA